MQIINPYNFISFGEDIKSNRKTREDVYRQNSSLVSGWLDVTLIPSTPLIIPDGAHPIYIDTRSKKVVPNPKEYERNKYHKKYDFMFRYDVNGQREYYIPGSSVRGMIRSVYEAATDSCVPFLLADKKKPISQRVPLYAALKQRGLLAFEYDEQKKGKVWKLYSTYADTEAVTVREEKRPLRGRDGKEITDHKGNPKTKSVFHFYKNDGAEITQPTGSYIKDKGVLQYNVPVDISKEYHIAYLTKKDTVYSWEQGDDEAYRLLNSVLMRDNVKGNQFNRNEKPAWDLKQALDRAKGGKGNMVPVYYFKVIRKHEDYEEEMVYLSNSSAGRIAQKRKWADIMAEHGPCAGNDLCPACLLFGSMNKNAGLRSRIRITDALPDKNLSGKDFSDKLLSILGEPRTSAFEFYLERPDGASYWNFDFYGVKETDKNGVDHTRYYDMAEAMPRGRKMYWHGKPMVSSQETKLNATMQAVESEFSFKVYFDEITDEQLNSLIWVLTFGENYKESKHQHKLGHAKPMGYGSVKLLVTGKHIRTIEQNENGFKALIKDEPVPREPAAGIDLNKQYVKELLRMSDIDAVGDNTVEYPVGKDGMIFSWFSENRLNADTVKTLPKPMDMNISMASFIRNERKKKDINVVIKEGDVMTAKVKSVAENAYGQFGVFVILPGNNSGLLHKKQMKNRISEYKIGDEIQIKIAEVKIDGRGKKYSVTDNI